MKPAVVFFIRIVFFALLCCLCILASVVSLSAPINLLVIFGGVLLTYPVVWLGRKVLDRDHTENHAAWTTTFVHCGMGMTLGIPIIRGVITHDEWKLWRLPVAPEIGCFLVIVTGAAIFLVVATLALRGFGAPFFLVLSRKLAVDWLYAWTRNPMVLAGLAFFFSLGIWFQSLGFLIWVLIDFTPAMIFFLKVFEERELEFRFGASYLEYRSRTPMLWPRKP